MDNTSEDSFNLPRRTPGRSPSYATNKVKNTDNATGFQANSASPQVPSSHLSPGHKFGLLRQSGKQLSNFDNDEEGTQ